MDNAISQSRTPWQNMQATTSRQRARPEMPHREVIYHHQAHPGHYEQRDVVDEGQGYLYENEGADSDGANNGANGCQLVQFRQSPKQKLLAAFPNDPAGGSGLWTLALSSTFLQTVCADSNPPSLFLQ